MRRTVLACALFVSLVALVINVIAQEPVPAKSLFPTGNKLLSFTLWRVGGDELACAYSQPPTYRANSDNEKDHIQLLEVFKKSGDGWQRMYREEVVVPISGIHTPWPGSDRLFLISQGGSTYNLRIFAYRAGQFSKVFEDGTKFQPEIVFGKDLSEYLLMPRFGLTGDPGGAVAQTPTRADIFRWTGREYVHVGTASWAKRLSSLPD